MRHHTVVKLLDMAIGRPGTASLTDPSELESEGLAFALQTRLKSQTAPHVADDCLAGRLAERGPNMLRISPTHNGNLCQTLIIVSVVVADAVMLYHLPAAAHGFRWVMQARYHLALPRRRRQILLTMHICCIRHEVNEASAERQSEGDSVT